MSYDQVTGGGSSLIMYRQTDRTSIASDSGVLVRFTTESFGSDPNKQASAVISGKRGAGKPRRGMPQNTGGFVMEMNPYLIGEVLRNTCGAPTTSAQAAKACSAAAAVNKGDGYVGIPCPAHGYVQDEAVCILGTTNYDGNYLVEAGSSTDEVVIFAPYVAETLTTGATVQRGRVAYLSGAVTNEGSGKVGLPVAATGHTVGKGDSITVDGTTNYDGTYTVVSVSPRKIVITDTYVAETLDGTPVVTSAFYKHSFSLPDKQPWCAFEKVLGYDAGAADYPVRRAARCKINGLSTSVGDDGEALLTVDVTVQAVTGVAEQLDAAPQEFSSFAFEQKEASFWLNGARRGDVQTGNQQMNFAIEMKSAVGDRGQYSRSSEGDPDCSCTQTVFVETDDLQQLADADITVEHVTMWAAAAGDVLRITYPEAQLNAKEPTIGGKTGLTQEITVMPFVDSASSVVAYEIINRTASYA